MMKRNGKKKPSLNRHKVMHKCHICGKGYECSENNPDCPPPYICRRTHYITGGIAVSSQKWGCK